MEKVPHTAAKPRIPAGLETVSQAPAFCDDDIRSDCRLEHCTLAGEARRVSLTRAVLRGVRLQAALPAAELEDVVFDGCDLSGADFSDAILLRTAFRNCRLTGANFGGAALRDVTFEACAAEYVNFRFTRWERAACSGCRCAKADFSESAFSDVRFARTDLRQAQMSGTSLAGMDLTNCNVDGLGARPQDLRGVLFTPEQAVTAAGIIGVRIRF